MFKHHPLRQLVMCAALVGALAACEQRTDDAAAESPAPEATPAADTTTPTAPDATAPQSPPATDASSAAALKYDGKIVHQPEGGRGKDDGWFLVKDGKRRWITDDQWPAANGYDPQGVVYVTTEEFYAIPEDPRPLPESKPDADAEPATGQ